MNPTKMKMPGPVGESLRRLVNSFTDDEIISDKGVNLDVRLTKEHLKITKEIPLSQLVDLNLVKEIKTGGL